MVLRRAHLARIGAMTAPALVLAAFAMPTVTAQAASQSLALAGTSSPAVGPHDDGQAGA